MFDELKAKYLMFALKGIDWDAVGRDLIPRVEAARTEEEFGLLVRELVARLEDSHAVVLPGTATPPNPPAPYFPACGPAIACLIDDRDRPVVHDVPAGTPAHKLGVRPGMAVVAVNGVPAAEALATCMGRLGLVPDVPVRCTARDLALGRDTVVEAAGAWLKEARAK